MRCAAWHALGCIGTEWIYFNEKFMNTGQNIQIREESGMASACAVCFSGARHLLFVELISEAGSK